MYEFIWLAILVTLAAVNVGYIAANSIDNTKDKVSIGTSGAILGITGLALMYLLFYNRRKTIIVASDSTEW
jgi:hypothetical protein